MRDLVLAAFRPRTSPPSLATVLRSILWPLAILFIIHRSYVLATNGYITDDLTERDAAERRGAALVLGDAAEIALGERRPVDLAGGAGVGGTGDLPAPEHVAVGTPAGR